MHLASSPTSTPRQWEPPGLEPAALNSPGASPCPPFPIAEPHGEAPRPLSPLQPVALAASLGGRSGAFSAERMAWTLLNEVWLQIPLLLGEALLGTDKVFLFPVPY